MVWYDTSLRVLVVFSQTCSVNCILQGHVLSQFLFFNIAGVIVSRSSEGLNT